MLYKAQSAQLILTPELPTMALNKTLLFSAFASLFFPLVLGTNHLTGVVASNSIGGTGTYTCRTQAQV